MDSLEAKRWIRANRHRVPDEYKEIADAAIGYGHPFKQRHIEIIEAIRRKTENPDAQSFDIENLFLEERDDNPMRLSNAIRGIAKNAKEIQEIFFRASLEAQTGELKASNPQKITLNQALEAAGLKSRNRGGDTPLIDYDLESLEWLNQFKRRTSSPGGSSKTQYTKTSLPLGYALHNLDKARGGTQEEMTIAIKAYLEVYEAAQKEGALKLPALHDKETFDLSTITIRERRDKSYVNVDREEAERILKSVKEGASEEQKQEALASV